MIVVVTILLSGAIGVLLLRVPHSLEVLSSTHVEYLDRRMIPASSRPEPHQALREFERLAEADETLIRNFSVFANDVGGQFLKLGLLLLSIAGIQAMLLFNLQKLLPRRGQ